MLRLPVALVMFPNEEVLIVDAGFAKFVWLNNPKVSNRNWNLHSLGNREILREREVYVRSARATQDVAARVAIREVCWVSSDTDPRP